MKIALVCLPVLFAAAHAPVLAADPDHGEISQASPRTQWSGGPFVLPNWLGCAGDADPTCDHFVLEVAPDVPYGALVTVTITPDPGFEGDDYDLFVFGPDGRMVAAATGPAGQESVVFEHTRRHDSGTYEVRVQPFATGSTYGGEARLGGSGPVDDPPDECGDLVPAALGARGLTDDGSVRPLRVFLLLDGNVSRALGESTIAGARAAYEPLGIDLTVVGAESVSFVGVDPAGLIRQSKDHFGGEVPDGADLVYLLTRKDLTIEGISLIGGMADCVGGVRYRNRAFAVGEVWKPFVIDAGVTNVSTNPDPSTVIAAHEIGHLLGAHHHLANCAEGLARDDVAPGAIEISPCTLMLPAPLLLSLRFSSLNGLVVRGYAVEFTGQPASGTEAARSHPRGSNPR